MPFIDLLTHIIPGVDDGPSTMDQSVRMAQAAAVEGSATLVSAPHLSDVELNSSVADVRQLVADLNSRLRREAADGAPQARVIHGMENRITPDLPDKIECEMSLLPRCRKFAELAARTDFVRYEDFVAHRDASMKKLCAVLDLSFDPIYATRWRYYRTISGDVWGSRGGQRIQKLPRRDYDEALLDRLLVNEDYQTTLALLGYHHEEAAAEQTEPSLG